ncbi:MAG: bifunctional metallophosphatase/5'-nucleotidase, partial [Candidatus Latescibacteria bacterium]|nr:bifunctional metallophosphatase/5'-nucleotidase [Candidatus Latescibacterota bacterium]
MRWLWMVLMALVVGAPVWAQRDTVTIVHSNDVFGQLKAFEKEGHIVEGGVARRMSRVEAIEGHKLILDAGNALGPSALSAWDQGQVMIDAMRQTGYAALVPGSHEFDYGLDVLNKRQTEAEFPFLGSNIRAKQGMDLPIEGYRSFTFGRVKVGVVGVVSKDLGRQIDPKVAERLVFEDPKKPLIEALKTLEDVGVDFVVLLAHMPEQEILRLVEEVEGVDLVIAGGYRNVGREKRLPTLTRLASGVEVVTTPAGGANLGLVRLIFEKEQTSVQRLRMTAEVVLIDGTNQPHPQIASSVERLFEMYQKETGDVLGIIEGKTLEAQVGAVANLMRWHTKMEVGVIHRGAFREKLKTDSLYVRDVERFVRFDYGLVKVQLSGAQLRSVIKRSQRAGKGDNGLIFAGLDVKAQTINGRGIQNKEPYQVITLAALAEGTGGYREFKDGEALQRTGIVLRSLLVNGLKAWGTLGPRTFSVLDRRPVWRSGWSVEGAFRRNYVDRTAESYQANKERVSFLRGETSVAWNMSTRYHTSYESGPHAVLFENQNDFGQVGTSFGELETSSDRFDAELTYRRRIQRWQVHPFVSSGINTAFTSGNGTRPFQLRSSLGFQRRTGRFVIRFAGRGQRDFAESQSDFGAEISATYQRRLQQGGRLRSQVK